MALDELAQIQQAHHRRFLGVQQAAADLAGQAWDTYAGLDDLAAGAFEAAAAVLADTAGEQISTLAVGYMAASDAAGGYPATGLVPILPTVRNGIPRQEIYHRSIVEARSLISRGAPFDQAMNAGRARATGTATTDVSLANRSEMNRGGAVRPWVVGYRRVLTGKSCAFCAVASTQRYRRAELLPLHPRCDCDIAEIFGTEDPGKVINRDLLDQLKAAGKTDGRPDYWNGPYLVDETGAVRYRKLETIVDDAGNPLRGKDGKPLRRTVAGDHVNPKVVEHGELGATLTDARHAATEVGDLSKAKSSTAPSSNAPRRTKAKLSDDDVIAEATRKNISPERVIELREAKAERRFLEQRAIREAERALSADDPEVVRLARRFGINPDELLSARARVADVRKAAREEAARIQADALRELDRIDALKVEAPPRPGARDGSGNLLRQGEYDWLEQVSARERARLSRQWYGGADTLAPDQLAENFTARLGGDFSVDQAMEEWLRLNRQAEAAGAVRRGKIPSFDAYSNQIEPNDLIGSLADEGYDAEILFGPDLEAAGHIASVEADLVQREALDYLGEAVGAVEGPSPYTMSFQAWEAEVRDLEYALRRSPTPAELRRYRELVPQYLDDPDLAFEDLYARIVSTARLAGEEVPAHAVIPWI